MNWQVWRQHRKLLIVLGILLVLFAALLIPTGLSFWHTYQHTRATCGETNACGQLSTELLQSKNDQLLITDLVPDAMLFLPVLIGLFWGVPLLAKEYAEGTNLLAWTRSVSRRKWLTVKLVWVLAGTAVFIGAFTALNTWWSKTPNVLYLDRFSTTQFGVQNIAPVAYGIFAVSLGIMFGAWFRRVMVTFGVTLGVLILIMLVAVPNFVRPHYMAPVTVTASMAQNALASKVPSGAWEISSGFVDSHGRVSSTPFDLSDWPARCQALLESQNGQGSQVAGTKPAAPHVIDDSLTASGFHQIAKYQPNSRYWDFQRIEACIYLGLAALAVGATYWLVLRRDA